MPDESTTQTVVQADFLSSVLSQIAAQGPLVAFELIVIVVGYFILKKMGERNVQLTDTIFSMHKETLGVVSKNSEVMAGLSEKIDGIKK